MNNWHEGKTLIKIAVTAFIVTCILAYIFFQSRNLIRGPVINLITPENGGTFANPLISIRGTAKNISFISLNNRQIFVDDDGNFKETLLLSPGYNLWKIEAQDKFGRAVSKKLELVLRENL